MIENVTVLGLGPMGRAMARAYLGAGYRVTVWNRTASKADALAAQGARRAGTVREALAAAELVVLSLTDYDAMYALLDPVADALSGRVLVNLSSDTPERARAAAKWAADHGAAHLTGGVQAAPPQIGRPEAYTFYSGPRDVFDTHREALAVLTRPDYRGEDPGLAAAYYQLTMDLFWTTTLGWLHSLAVARAHGISAADFLPHASSLLAGLPDFLAFYSPRIDAGDHPGDAERLTMGAASVDHVVRTTADAGVDTALPDAVHAAFRRGVAAGFGEDSMTKLVEVLGNSEIPGAAESDGRAARLAQPR
ncbi:NAD(P)-dependent oxidoreductase [Amycolatopsis sp. 195334CR]|uniref:NAD(P)-dependent oxidoreductase n=1 Tax=Amycolatopsis sp. 195334CR TaxID=2814588 RepID=UPI001A8D5DD9|nr:NAD(P)-binding domain-containing protein [Amycolatopsis sp. 195334CR]MBN6042157.1 NAD(P)-dependent oxidoreductase [Amycolatopsis sp. 195334CR]